MNLVTLPKRVFIITVFFLLSFLSLYADNLKRLGGKDAENPSVYEGKYIREVRVKGEVNIRASKIKALCGIDEGTLLDLEEINKALKTMLDSGLFENAAIDATEEKDGSLVITVFIDEMPELRYISFAGNDNKSKADLEEIIAPYLTVGEIFSEAKLRAASEAIVASYREDGYLMAYVKHDIRVDKRSESVEVVINIEEGREVRVRKITFHGNKEFGESELRTQMETKQDTLFTPGKFKEADFEADKRTIENFYKDRGYYHAEVRGARITYRWNDPEKKKTKDMYIDIDLHEGERYTFGDISVNGNRLLTTESIVRDFKAEKGRLYSHEYSTLDLQTLQMKYSEKGYIFSRVRPIVSVDETNKTVSILYDIYEGDKAHIENIIIRGNDKTKNFVIARNITVKEGEIFNAAKILESREKIYNTQFFKNVNVMPKPGTTEGLMNLIFDVEEEQTGMVSAGGGWGNSTGFSMFAEIKDINFLGRGLTYNFRGEFGQERRRISAGFIEPYLFKQPFYFGSDISFNNDQIETDILLAPSLTPDADTNTNYPPGYEPPPTQTNTTDNDDVATYWKNSFDVALRLGHYFANYYQTYFSYSMSIYQHYQSLKDGATIDGVRVNTVDIASGMTNYNSKYSNDVFGYPRWQTEWFMTHMLSLNLTRDSRNNYISPTRGWRTSLEAKLYMGHTKLTKFLASASYVLGIPFGRKYTSSLVGYAQYGFILPDFLGNLENEGSYLFYMNYVEDVRGWASSAYGQFKQNRELAPYSSYGDDGLASYSSLGRDRMRFSLEWRFPCVPGIFDALLFLDGGQTWYPERTDEEIQNDVVPSKVFPSMDKERNIFTPGNYVYSTGFGIRILYQVFPIRVYFAKRFVYNPQSYADRFGLEQGFTYYEGDTQKQLFNMEMESDFWRGWEVVLSMTQPF